MEETQVVRDRRYANYLTAAVAEAQGAVKSDDQVETADEEEEEPLIYAMDGVVASGGDVNASIYFNIFVGAQVIGFLMIALTFIWVFKYLGGFGWQMPALQFNYHPLFMVIGLVYLYGNSILIYRVLRKQPKPKLKLIHAALNGLAFCCAVFGLVAVFQFHNRADLPNLYSLHSWIGLLTVILFGLQFVGGFVSFLYPTLSGHYRKMILPYHVFFGILLFTLAIATCLSGLTEKAFFSLKTKGAEYKDKPAASYLINFLGLTIVVFGSVVGYLVTKEDYKRQPLPDEQVIQQRVSQPF
ncbi:cytochrome b561-like isoform X1 [Leptotrombidium deliense]|uniref:Cytochrome b561-like isoform X1 n=1 Tax=Leptotrombidium deliense TaxID=299467 RepID=A0A443S6X7_9ACAR|nr:cytochrome b561-like isoform X1 [Leptotrombidium deliense]